MISFFLKDPTTGARHDFEPRPWLRVTGTSLQTGEGEPLASFRGGLWFTPEGEFGVLTVDSAVRVVFQGDESPRLYGPFERVLIVGGVLRHGPQPDDLLARLDDQAAAWEMLWDHSHYPTILLLPPDSSAPGREAGERSRPGAASSHLQTASTSWAQRAPRRAPSAAQEVSARP
jgi:hypothetical protein